MRLYILSILSLFFFSASFAAPKKIKFNKNGGNWYSASNWMPNGLPQSGDTVLIPAGTTLKLETDVTLDNVVLDIYGELLMLDYGMKINLNNKSSIVVHTGGVISGFSASQQIVINSIIFKGNNNPVVGPQLASGSTNGFVSFKESNLVVLPVQFVRFDVAVKNGEAILQWSAAEQDNNFNYEVERSIDGSNWKKIASVKATGGAGTVNQYSYTDKSITANSFYRIKQADAGGKTTYTAVKSVQVSAAIAIVATAQQVLVQFPKKVQGAVGVQVVSINGLVMAKQTVYQPEGQVVLPNTQSLKGAYIIIVSNGQDVNTSRQVIL